MVRAGVSTLPRMATGMLLLGVPCCLVSSVSRLPSLPSTIANEGSTITPLPGRTIIRRHRVTNRPTLPGGSELRIVALTARGMRAEHQRAFDAGCDDLIANAGLIRTEDSRREAPSFRTRRQGHSSGTVGGLPDTPPAQKCPSFLARPARFERATCRFEA
jgi:hypothetical protein